MLVCQCDVCGATAKPRVYRQIGARVVVASPVGTSESHEHRVEEAIVLPTGWSELRHFAGFDKEVPFGSEAKRINAGESQVLRFQPLDVVYLTDLRVVADDSADPLGLKDLEVFDVSVGRMSSSMVSHDAISAESFVVPEELLQRAYEPWTFLDVCVRNKGNETRTCRLFGTLVPVTLGGVAMRLQSRFLCPDHTPKTRPDENKPVLIDRAHVNKRG